MWLPLAIFFLLVEAFCALSRALLERHEEKLTCLSPSNNLSVSAPSKWNWRYPFASLLPILSCWNCCLNAWGILLGHLEACASIHIQIPLGASKGGTQRRDGGHTSESQKTPLFVRGIGADQYLVLS